MTSLTSLLKTTHKGSYPAISPSRPELSQVGRTVLITGGSTGVGYAIARGFAQASASRIIISGRREEVLKAAVGKLVDDFPKVQFVGKQLDVADLQGTDELWADLGRQGITVDVLVLNASSPSHPQPILEAGFDKIWQDFIINVRTLLVFAEKFYKQPSEEKDWNNIVPEIPGYGLTKSAGTLLIQQIAKDTSPKDMQVLSFHPGSILTETVRRVMGNISDSFDFDGYDFDDEDLCGHFAVWAASREAEFLHGRFMWAAWDVDELRKGEIRKLIDEETYYLQIGVKGLT
ncbi:short-chain dehydrogenase [Daldinia childiae]|uniref:short-chain dehydrogenase n=1 Tax=Daldinia childiae TaxID=326645 RepID=UPI0014453678|nr:short-chain dehydrogenase [Daldinia childiae]KAF3065801.1 short-chain dehydrogenase [Daldinia childiae]